MATPNRRHPPRRSRSVPAATFTIATGVSVLAPAPQAQAVNPARHFQKHHKLHEPRERPERLADTGADAEVEQEAEPKDAQGTPAPRADHTRQQQASSDAVAERDEGFLTWLARRLTFSARKTRSPEAPAPSPADATTPPMHQVVRPTLVQQASSQAAGADDTGVTLPMQSNDLLNDLVRLRHDRFLGLLVASGLLDDLRGSVRWRVASVDNATLDAMDQERLRALLVDPAALRVVLTRHISLAPTDAATTSGGQPAGVIALADRLRLTASSVQPADDAVPGDG